MSLWIIVSTASACSTTINDNISNANINPQDLLIVDCLLPPQARQLGTRLTYLTQRRAIRTSGADCALRGGEYIAYNRADFKSALAVWLPQAEQGDPKAQTYVGEIYEKGLGTRASYELAASWYQRAAHQDYSRAKINLGYLYESGLGVERNLPRALNLYREASGFTAAEIDFVSSVKLAEQEAERIQAQQLQAQIELLHSEISAGRRTLAAQKSQLQENENEIRELRESLENRKQAMSRDSNAALTRKFEFQDHQQKLNALEKQLSGAVSQKQTLQGQLDRQNENTATLQAQLSLTSETLDVLRLRDNSNTLTIEKLENQVETQADDSAAAFDALLKAKNLSTALAREIELLEIKAHEQDNMYSELKSTTRESTKALNRQIEQQNSIISKIEKQQKIEKARHFEDLAEQNAQLQQTKLDKQRQSEQHNVQRASDEQRIQVLQQRIKNRETEIAIKSTAIENLQRVLVTNQGASNRLERLIQQPAAPGTVATTAGLAETIPFDNIRLPIKDVKLGNYHALIIGNDKYASLGNLKTAGNDAIAIEKILREKYGFKTVLLLDANQKTMLSALERMRTTLKKQDNLIIYYAGHGELDKQSGLGYWLPIDSHSDNKDNWIANSAITSMVDAIDAKHVLVIADSCFSGAVTRSSIPRPLSGVSATLRLKWLKAVAQSRVRTVLISGSNKPVQDESTNSRHSIFSQKLLEALERNTEVLESYELFFELQQSVSMSTSRLIATQRPQYAPIRHAGHQAGEFIFAPIAQTTVGASIDK